MKSILKKGHFGIWPVRTSWFLIVFPSVVVNYLGQGALLIHHPESVENPYEFSFFILLKMNCFIFV
jgi:KUP system potassium uptake protein